MAIDIYGHLADAAGVLGMTDAQTIAGAGQRSSSAASQALMNAKSAIVKGNVPNGPKMGVKSGLPPVLLTKAQRDAATLNHLIGSTEKNPVRIGAPKGNPTQAARNAPFFVEVTGQPSMKLIAMPGGGVEIHLERKSKYAGDFSDADKKAIEQFAAQWSKAAIGMSKGRLNQKKLNAMNNPYGFGAFAPSGRKRHQIPKKLAPKKYRDMGASNMAVLNEQSGKLKQSWKSRVEWKNDRAILILSNDTEYSSMLAFGTRKMRAHGPFTTAPTLFLAQLNTVWRDRSKLAYLRKNALPGVK